MNDPVKRKAVRRPQDRWPTPAPEPEKPAEKGSETNPFLLQYSWLPTYSLKDDIVDEDEDATGNTRTDE